MKTKLEAYAQASYAQKQFTREWFIFILITLLVKFSAMAFSIFAGYFFFHSLLAPVLPSPSLVVFFSILTLLIIEVLNAILISKSAKFFLHGNLKASIITLIAAGGIFYISFISSANGLALRQSTKVDIKESIIDSTQIILDNINSKFDKERVMIEGMIQTIKENPAGWQNGQREVLTSSQLKQIDKYYQDLKTIELQRQEALKASNKGLEKEIEINDQNKRLEASKYYTLVTIVMVIIFLTNALLMWFWAKIYREKTPLQITEVYDKLNNELQGELINHIENQLQDTYWNYLSSIKSFKPTPAQLKPIRPKPKAQALQDGQKACKHCGNPFDPSTKLNVFCSENCRSDFWRSKK